MAMRAPLSTSGARFYILISRYLHNDQQKQLTQNT